MKTQTKEIPKSFILGGMKFTTIFKDKIISEKTQVGGLSDPYECKIEIAETVDGSNCSPDYQRQTFYHELMHQLLYIIGDLELGGNEEFVQRLSLLLDQFEQTKEF